MPHVFISYLREDASVVDLLAQELRARDIQVWVDREKIMPGQMWEIAIRQAIEEGAYFLACFSSSYEQREDAYMNEELIVAIEKLRKRRPIGRSWFIPVLLDKCKVPASPIGAGKTLRDLQWVDLSENRKDGIERIVKTIHGEETVIAGMPPRAPEDPSQIGTAGEPAIEPSGRPRFWSRLLVNTGVPIAVLLAGFAITIWQRHVDRCLGAFDALAKLDESYGYGFCSLAEDTDDDSRLAERIEPVLRRAEGCNSDLADQHRIDFYRNVQKNLRGDTSVCKSPEKDEQEGVWFRLHCLQHRPVDPNRPVTVADTADWARLAGEFETLVPKTSEPARGPLQNCAAISRATVYRSLAAITGRPEATDHMIVAAKAIRKSEETHIAQLVSKGLAEYNPMVRRPFNENELKTANMSLDSLLGQEGKDEKEEAALWGHILPSVHRHVQLAALGVVVDHMAQSRSKSPEEEQNYHYYFNRLESGLRNAVERDKKLAADFLLAKRETMKGVWYQATIPGATTDCEHGAADRQQSGAVTLESMRAIYGWWAQTKLDLSTEQWADLQKQGPPWLNWWSLQDEVTTTLCSLATDLIDSKEAKRRLARVLKIPEGGGLCYSAQAQRELWQAGTKKLPWLRDMAKEKCPS